jgi:hypothetical protein
MEIDRLVFCVVHLKPLFFAVLPARFLSLFLAIPGSVYRRHGRLDIGKCLHGKQSFRKAVPNGFFFCAS